MRYNHSGDASDFTISLPSAKDTLLGLEELWYLSKAFR